MKAIFRSRYSRIRRSSGRYFRSSSRSSPVAQYSLCLRRFPRHVKELLQIQIADALAGSEKTDDNFRHKQLASECIRFRLLRPSIIPVAIADVAQFMGERPVEPVGGTVYNVIV